MNPPAIVILGEASIPVARQIQTALPEALVYGLASRTQSANLTYDKFGETVRELFQAGTPIIGVCAAGILIRTLAPLLTNKWQEPPVLAIAEDSSAVVPLLGGLQNVNDLARQIAAVLQVAPAITTAGDLRFRTALLSPPSGYQLVNPDAAKPFISDLLAGAAVKLVGEAPWLETSHLPISPEGKLTIQIVQKNSCEQTLTPGKDCLVYRFDAPLIESTTKPIQGKLAIVGTGPGAPAWMSPEVKDILQSATDWVGYKTYLDLAEPLRKPNTTRHESDNRVELDRARMALKVLLQKTRKP